MATKSRAFELKAGDVIRAPWRDMGDDPELTGTVWKRFRDGSVEVRWHGNGTVTPAGDESVLAPACPVELVETLPATEV